MNEWTVVVALATIIGLFMAVGKPILDLNTTITELKTTVQEMIKDLKELKEDNSASHKDMNDKIANHESRITVLENKDNGGKK